ncbi:hypothetical protein EPUS_01719 [Endocarpon pusillum Z07020]|uniref:DUF676 domain-containing protein n=1 Tax=Endocarpon pusillum (strain Z07020 / HMAS-L-300199) TaxID=1263415 RepID=U1HRN5_ENDPU|nr:uncharacterized protein EPUS_01719 [Endocarpon pusillum Z07020]ERF71804.1 hypothetical protein EPUS_01719 [Endocarpon pusillum Z07020]
MSNSKSFLHRIYPIDTNDTEGEVDIIAVHGLDPLNNPLHATETWTAANGNLWLKDFLPLRQPRIRVFLYGYNSSAVFGASITGVNGAAENLLNYLRLERQLDQNRPIVWVSHSLGGLVVKKAIINAYVSGDYYKSIHDATRGVIFFGTPHRGGNFATLGDRMAQICRVVTGNVRNNIMETLRKDSMFAGDINKDFARRAAALELRVVNFIENLPIARHLGLVVPQSSAALDWPEPAEIKLHLEATHTAMCKFGERNEMYKLVEDNVCELLTWSINSAIASTQQVQLLPKYPHATEAFLDPALLPMPGNVLLGENALLRLGPRMKYEPSMESLTGGVAKDHKLGGSSPWLSKLAGLRPFSNLSSFRPPGAKSTTSDSSTDTMTAWPIRMLPHPRPTSIVRRAQLFEKLLVASGDGPVALHGIGGVGKTQLAVRLAYWFLDRDPEFSVIWIHAASVETCAEGLRTFAKKYGIVDPQNNPVSDQHFPRTSLVKLLRCVRTWLGRAPVRKWLIVFDSAEEGDALTSPLTELGLSLEGDDVQSLSIIDCVPAGGFVVFTTKSRAAAAKFSHLKFGKMPEAGKMLEVGRFSLEEATLMLEMGLDDDLLMGTPTVPQQRSLTLDFGNGLIEDKIPHGVRQYRTDRASELAEKLDCLPLAISQAAAFMNKNRLSTADYLQRMTASSDEMLAELMARPQPLETQMGVPRSIYDTWRLSYQTIQSHKPLAVDVLAFMSFLEEDSIILSLLQAAFCVGTDVKLVDALGELRNYELIHSGSVPDIFTMHRLVQATTIKWLKERKINVQWARAVLMTIADKFPNPENSTSWPECAAWLPHASKILRVPLFETAADKAALATLHLKVGHYYFQTGRWSEAQASTEIASNLRTEIFGPLEMPTLEAKDQLIQIVRQLGQFNLAEATAREVKRYRKRQLGIKNELTLKSYGVLGMTLDDQGQYAEALRYAEKALKGFQDLHGATDPLHPDILISTYRLGASYELIGNFSKSETLLSEALQGLNQRGQGETQHVSEVLHRLSHLQRGLGNYRESEESALASMKMRRKLLGWDHPDTTKAYLSAGWSIQCQERYQESADVFTAVVQICKPKIGAHHADTYTASYFLAESLKGLGEFGQAKELHSRVLMGRKKALRSHHPDILTSQVGLAGVLLILRDFKEAEELTLEVYNFLKKEGKIFKERAAIAWTCMSNMGQLHSDRALRAGSESERKTQWKEAIKWARQLVESQEHVLGSRHPKTIKASQTHTKYLNGMSGRRHSTNSSIPDSTVANVTPFSRMTLAEQEDEKTPLYQTKSMEEK